MEMVGLRPGEKLHEQLFYDAEEVEQTVNAKVLRALAPAPPQGVREDVKHLLAMATGEDEASLRLALLAYVSRLGEDPRTAEQAEASGRIPFAVTDGARGQFLFDGQRRGQLRECRHG